MSFFHSLLTQSSEELPAVYGNIDDLFPEYTYEQKTDIRLSNWELLKNSIDNNDTTFISSRLEVYVAPDDEYIFQTASKSISGINKEVSEIVCYPFAKGGGDTKIFVLGYGSNISLNRINLKLAAKHNKYESYQCILKYDDNNKQIQLLGDIRPEFWTETQVGDLMFYSWNLSVLAPTNTIASLDEENKIITLTNDISASANNDNPDEVWFGIPFKESISVDDYNEYGRGWVYNANRIFGLYCIPAGNSGTPFHINLNNANVENFHGNLNLSAGNGYVNINGQSTIKNAGSVGLSFFGRNTNGEKIININGRLTIEGSGTVPVGSVSVLTGTLGGGIYVHPNVQIHGGDLYLIDNPAASCRQYSSTGSVTNIIEGAYTELDNVICSNSGEYDMMTSHMMPTTIHNLISSSYLWLHYDTTINGGIVNELKVGGGMGMLERDHLIQFNNCQVTGHYNGVGVEITTISIVYNDCEFIIPVSIQSGGNVTTMLATSSIIDLLELNRCYVHKGLSYEYTLGEALSTVNHIRGAGFISVFRPNKIILNNVSTDQYFGEFLTAVPNVIEQDHIDNIVKLNNCNIRTSIFSLTANVVTSSSVGRSNLFEGLNNKIITINQGLSYNMPNKIGLRSGQIVKDILESTTYKFAPQSVIFTPNNISTSNILEIDWEHDEYIINGGGIINHIAPVLYYQAWKGTCSNQMQGIITLIAIDGDIIINTRDESTNPFGNIKDSTVISSGTSKQFQVDSNDILSNSADSIQSDVVGTTTTSKEIHAYFGLGLARPAISTITIGSVVGVSDIDGVITGEGIEYGFIDFLSGHFYILLTDTPVDGTDIEIEYTKINDWRASGTWSLIS